MSDTFRSIPHAWFAGFRDWVAGMGLTALTAYPLLMPYSSAALPYQWLYARTGGLAAPLILISWPLTLPLGFVFSLLDHQLMAALTCTFASACMMYARGVTARRQKHGAPDATRLALIIGFISCSVLAWRYHLGDPTALSMP